ncbi:MAG TPA: CPBP family glutamic-type intramembrane protease [Clostridia bacterium]|nr:CPBP family glutamic-type intramembrane protease [Clostridia bacterium]
MTHNTAKLYALLISLLALWALSSALHMILLWFIVMNLLAVYIIAKYRIFDRTTLVTGVVMGLLCVPSHPVIGILTILPFIASMAVFKHADHRISFFQNGTARAMAATLLLIFVVGGILSAINALFAMRSWATNPSLKFKWIFVALCAGISEEIVFRLFFFALCVFITRDRPLSSFQNALCYTIMVVPHALAHFDLETVNMIHVGLLSLIFGLPFALMQRKTNLVSAMGAHALVDAVRFCIFGM